MTENNKPDNRKKHSIIIRLSDRELEMLEEVKKERGVKSHSDGGRFCLVYTYYGLSRERELGRMPTYRQESGK